MSTFSRSAIGQRSISLLITLASLCLCGISSAVTQGSPDVVWEVPTPSGLSNSVVGVGWGPAAAGSKNPLSGQVAMGSTDRWLRTRQAASGALAYSILGPQHSRGGDQTIYSTNGEFFAVHYLNRGLDYRVYRAADGFFLGTILVTLDANGLVQFAPDAQLQGSIPKDAFSHWHAEEFTVVFGTGSGYQITTTSINFSADGRYQSVASVGNIKILSRKDGSTVSTFPGGAARGSTPMNFTPDSAAIAAWDGDSNQTTLWRVADGAILRQFPDAVPNEGITAIRFSPDGSHMVTSGYLPFQDGGGLWQQFGNIRFWRVSDGALRQQFNQHTGIGVTSAIAWSPDATQFIYGTYEGSVVAAHTPAP